MFSIASVNHFEIKDRSIEFVINNVSPEGNNVKINLNLEDLQRMQFLFVVK